MNLAALRAVFLGHLHDHGAPPYCGEKKLPISDSSK